MEIPCKNKVILSYLILCLILVISAIGSSVPSIFCILKFLLFLVYLRDPALSSVCCCGYVDFNSINFLIGMELPGTGVLEETLDGGLRLAYPIHNQNMRFSLPYLYDLTKTFDTLFMT